MPPSTSPFSELLSTVISTEFEGAPDTVQLLMEALKLTLRTSKKISTKLVGFAQKLTLKLC
jgi:hypothetical protein